ncbi:MAG: class II aldolase/adducin family protein, partial [Desulfovibrio sp.]|nr:class II aldolase/adducin family protein [Desulfovibrio sp.]
MPLDGLKKNAKAEITRLSHDAWLWGLFSAQNGNISQKLPAPYDSFLMITAQGSCKGHLEKNDFCCLDMRTGVPLEGSRVSSECKVHLGLYAAC